MGSRMRTVPASVSSSPVSRRRSVFAALLCTTCISRFPPAPAIIGCRPEPCSKRTSSWCRCCPTCMYEAKIFCFAPCPSGESEVLLSVPNYDFHWQINYYLKTPKLLPKGTLLECVGHFDNSPNNPSNPNPKVDVSYGEQTWEEMLNGFMEVAIDPRIPTPELYASAPATSAALVNR